MEKNSVVFFGRLPPPLTGENMVSDTIIKILQKHYPVFIIDISVKHEKKNGFFVKLKYHSRQAFLLVKSFYRLNHILNKEQISFLYFSGCSTIKASYLDFLLLKIAGKRVKKVICHLHNSTYKNVLQNNKTGISSFLINSVDKYICLSRKLSCDLQDVIPENKREVLPNMIDRNVILSNEEFLHKLNSKRDSESFIVTYISNFIISKGYFDLAEAIFLIPETLKNKITVRFIGAWVDADDVKKDFFRMINRPEVKKCIEYIGPVSNRSHIKQLLTESDIFCLPTYYPVEAQPLCIIEAMNAGNAIISTWHASIPEYVRNETDGLLFEKRNVQQLANNIIRLCNRNTLEDYSINSRNNFIDNFNENKIIDSLKNIFKI